MKTHIKFKNFFIFSSSPCKKCWIRAGYLSSHKYRNRRFIFFHFRSFFSEFNFCFAYKASQK